LNADLATVQVTYGKEGEEAELIGDSNLKTLSGTITPGRAKRGDHGFAVPNRSMGDVVVEVAPDFEHDSAIFAGAIKK
jgi:hypothetical protein